MAKSSNQELSFKTVLLLAKKTATGLQVPDKIVEQLNAGKKPAVYVTINKFTYRSTIATMDGKFMIPVSAEIRAGAKVAAGDNLNVSVRLDTDPREVAVPEDLQKLLKGDKKASEFFNSLSNSNKKRIVLPIEDAKTPETRTRRVEKAMEILKSGKI